MVRLIEQVQAGAKSEHAVVRQGIDTQPFGLWLAAVFVHPRHRFLRAGDIGVPVGVTRILLGWRVLVVRDRHTDNPTVGVLQWTGRWRIEGPETHCAGADFGQCLAHLAHDRLGTYFVQIDLFGGHMADAAVTLDTRNHEDGAGRIGTARRVCGAGLADAAALLHLKVCPGGKSRACAVVLDRDELIAMVIWTAEGGADDVQLIPVAIGRSHHAQVHGRLRFHRLAVVEHRFEAPARGVLLDQRGHRVRLLPVEVERTYRAVRRHDDVTIDQQAGLSLRAHFAGSLRHSYSASCCAEQQQS